MRFLNRLDNAQSQSHPSGGPDSGSGALNQIRAQADDMLAAGDAAIRNALGNGNSQDFLRAARQQGGE